MKKIVAMVPIKLNNERLPNKNIKELSGQPLIKYILNTLSEIEIVDEIYVFCSDEAIIPYLPEKVKFLKREKFLDAPTANFTQFFEAFAKQVKADIYVFTHATAPFIKEETVRLCIDKVMMGEYDSAFSAIKIQDFLWKNGEPLNFNAANIPRTQDLEPIYRETSGIYVFKQEVFNQFKRRIGNTPFVAEVSWIEAVDINTEEDFEIAQMVMSSKKDFNLIFDLDGVLIDSEKVQEYAYYESYKEIVADDKCPDFSEYMKHTGDSLTNIFKKMGLPVEMAEPYKRISNENIDRIIINNEVIDFIRKIKKENRGIKCSICTGKDHKRTHDILEHFHLTYLFDAVVCSDDVKQSKPSAEPTIYAMHELGGTEKNTLLIGDGYNDILSAKNANVSSMLTLWYGEHNVPREADYVAKTVDEFKEIILRLLKNK